MQRPRGLLLFYYVTLPPLHQYWAQRYQTYKPSNGLLAFACKPWIMILIYESSETIVENKEPDFLNFSCRSFCRAYLLCNYSWVAIFELNWRLKNIHRSESATSEYLHKNRLFEPTCRKNWENLVIFLKIFSLCLYLNLWLEWTDK